MTLPTLDDLVLTLHHEADDVCTGAELMIRLSSRPRRRRRTSVIAVAAGIATAVVLTVVLAMRHAPDRQPLASSGSPSARSSPSGTPTTTMRVALQSEVPASVTIPSGWSWSRYRGVPGTIASALVFVGNERLPPACVDTGHASCTSSDWFPPSWRVPERGVLIVWSEFDNPTISGHPLKFIPGHRTTIDGRPAIVSRRAPDGQCPPDTDSQIVAFVAKPAPSAGSFRYGMTACLGNAVSTHDRSRVYAMLHSLDIRPLSTRIAVPDVRHERRSPALAVLRAAGLRYRVVRESGLHTRPGFVVAQYPSRGERVPPGTIVQLTVAK